MTDRIQPEAARMEIEALRSRQCLHGISEPSGWMPIETAPKDGRVLWLGYYNAHGNWRTLRGEWISADQIAECCEEEAEPGWYETAVEAEDPPNAWATSPTHWRPLPKPPTDKGATDD